MKRLIAVAIISVFLFSGCKLMGLNFSLKSMDTEEVNEAEGTTE